MINFYQLFLSKNFQNFKFLNFEWKFRHQILGKITKYIIYLHYQNLVPKFQPNFKIKNLEVEKIGNFCCNFEYCLFKNCFFLCCLFARGGISFDTSKNQMESTKIKKIKRNQTESKIF